MKQIKKNEYTLEEIADRERIDAIKEMQVQGYRNIIRGLSVTVVASIILGGVVAIKHGDDKKDHLDEYCIYCNLLGLKHQSKMIEKQYGTETFATNLKNNNQQLDVYYLDDEGEKKLIKSFYK